MNLPSLSVDGVSFDGAPLTGAQVNKLLNISTTTRWRLEKRGLLVPVPNLRRKLYAQAAIRRFLDSAAK